MVAGAERNHFDIESYSVGQQKNTGTIQTIEVETFVLAESTETDDGGGFFGVIGKLQEVWTSIMELRSWLGDRDRENSQRMADFFNIDSQLRASEHLGNQDGTMSLLVKGQTNRVINKMTAITDSITTLQTTLQTEIKKVDTNLFILVSRVNETNGFLIEIRDLIIKTNTRLDNISNRLSDSNDYLSSIKTLTTTTNSKLDVLASKLTDANNYLYQLTGLIVKANSIESKLSNANGFLVEIRDLIIKTNSRLDNISNRISDSNDYLNNIKTSISSVDSRLSTVVSKLTDANNYLYDISRLSVTANSIDSKLRDANGFLVEIRDLIIKTNTRLDNISNRLSDTNTYLSNSNTYLINIEKAIKNLSGVGSGSGGDSGPVVDKLEQMRQMMSPFEKLLKDIKDGISNIEIGDIELINEAGTNLWDFLTALTDGITDTIQGILDFLDSLLNTLTLWVVPEDTTFIKTWFDSINQTIDTKFAVVDDLQLIISGSFNVEQRNFEQDYIVNFPVYGEVKVFETEYINRFLPLIRQMLSGMMILLTAIWAYRKITGNGGVVE